MTEESRRSLPPSRHEKEEREREVERGEREWEREGEREREFSERSAINRGRPDHISQSEIEIWRRHLLSPSLSRDLIMWDMNRDYQGT